MADPNANANQAPNQQNTPPSGWEIYISNLVSSGITGALNQLGPQMATQIEKTVEEKMKVLAEAVEAHKKMGEDVKALQARFEKMDKQGWWRAILYVAGTAAVVVISQAVYRWLFHSDSSAVDAGQPAVNFANGTAPSLGGMAMSPMH